MSISIQSSAAAQLATLEALTSQSGKAAGAGATSLLNATTPQDASSSIIDLSGGSAATGGVATGLATAASIADAAVASGTTIEGLLAQMRQDAVSASDASLDSDSRAALDSGFKANLAKIQQAISAAGVGGVNLLDGSTNGDASVSAATLSGVNLSLGGPVIGVGAGASLGDPSGAAAIATQLGAAIDKVGQAVDQISAQGQAIESHLSLVAQAGLSVSGVNGGLDADGARLAALQVQQQMSLTSGAVANQSPNAILALFQAG
ncbi:MAG TPA: flagellin [Caulobacteraceae bacterium]|jgi:flagellin|nr:flagellin [Caulobacteraceae bacterium]